MNPELVEFMKLLMDYGVIPIIGFGVYELRQMRKSVTDLNITMASVMEKQNSHDNRIGRLEDWRDLKT